MRASRLAASVIALWAGVAGAADYSGTYGLTAGSDCSILGMDHPNGTIVISEGVFSGIESSCRMTRPVDVIGMDATLFTFECAGEGLQWDMRVMLMWAAEGGIYVIRDGFAAQYPACP